MSKENNTGNNNNNAENSSINQDARLKSSLDSTKTWTDHFAVFIIRVFGSIGFLASCILFLSYG